MTRSSQDALSVIAALSGYSIETVSGVFDALGVYALLQQLEGQPFSVPDIGSVTVTYKGDTIMREGKRAILDVSMVPDDFLVRCVGQLHDGVITDAEMHIKKLNEKSLIDKVM
jgi:hypothetical protein